MPRKARHRQPGPQRQPQQARQCAGAGAHAQGTGHDGSEVRVQAKQEVQRGARAIGKAVHARAMVALSKAQTPARTHPRHKALKLRDEETRYQVRDPGRWPAIQVQGIGLTYHFHLLCRGFYHVVLPVRQAQATGAADHAQVPGQVAGGVFAQVRIAVHLRGAGAAAQTLRIQSAV